MLIGNDTRPVILCLGDSLTYGYGVLPEESYPALLQQRLRGMGLPHRVVNAGLPGETTAGARERLPGLLQGPPPSLAIVALGINDLLEGEYPRRIRDQLDSIIVTFKRARVPLLLAGMRLPPEFNDPHSQAFEELFGELARIHEVPLVPFLLEGVEGHPELTLGDGLHPNAIGYRKVEAVVWGGLAPLLATAGEPSQACGGKGSTGSKGTPGKLAGGSNCPS
ncbi:MAG: arylesterase [Magnetococcales bacterium]|nr:arylesterase [Magnetococcales bacterium]